MIKKQKNIFINFKEGYSRLAKIIEIKTGVKISIVGASHEWTIHKDRFHLKKINLSLWEDSKEGYMHINLANYKDFHGIGGLCAELFYNGVSLSKEQPSPQDIILKVNKSFKERICLYFGICKCDEKMMRDNLNQNNVRISEKISFDLIDVITGIKEGI